MKEEKLASDTQQPQQGLARPGMQSMLMLAGVILMALCLRAPITSVGPVIREMSRSMGLSDILAGMVTTIPLLAFGLLSGAVSLLVRRYRVEGVLLASLGLLIAGLLIRPVGTIPLLLAGTALTGSAITVGNVLMPPFIKLNYPGYIGLMTGVYAGFMNLSAALASGFSIPLGRVSGFGWKGSIGVWVILALLAFIVWLPLVLKGHYRKISFQKQGERPSLWRSRLAWQVTVFMGMQSTIFYCIIAWLPVMLQDRGMTPDGAGWLLSWFQLAQLPVMFGGPVIAGRMKNQIPLIWITGICLVAGTAGFLSGNNALIVPSTISIGVAAGLGFSLAMIFFSLRTSNAAAASALSGMAQSVGYSLAATGPLIFGALHDWTGGWTWSLAFLMVISFTLLISGLGSARDKQV